jgi:hypothetical protein
MGDVGEIGGDNREILVERERENGRERERERERKR